MEHINWAQRYLTVFFKRGTFFFPRYFCSYLILLSLKICGMYGIKKFFVLPWWSVKWAWEMSKCSLVLRRLVMEWKLLRWVKCERVQDTYKTKEDTWSNSWTASDGYKVSSFQRGKLLVYYTWFHQFYFAIFSSAQNETACVTYSLKSQLYLA